MAQIIAIANQKGGVGKTTTAVALAAALADSGAPTLLVDCDPQANATAWLGVDRAHLQGTLFTLVQAYLAGEPADAEGVLALDDYLALIPGHIDLAALEQTLFNADSREFVLRDVLAPYQDQFAWMILDCPPALGMLTLNALVAADAILVPQLPDELSAQGLPALWETVRRVDRIRRRAGVPPLRWAGLFLTLVRKIDPHKRMRAGLAEWCAGRGIPFLSATLEEQAQLPPPADRVEIPQTVHVARAYEMTTPVSRFDADGARGAYRLLAQVIQAQEAPHAR